MVIFEPFTMKGVAFKNRVIRSSIGGRTAYYDGTVSNAWKNFEGRFAENGVAGIVSATLNVNPKRWSPIEYPQISADKFITPLAAGIAGVHAHGCRYIIQIGDGGSHVQTSLFSQPEDSFGPSPPQRSIRRVGGEALPIPPGGDERGSPTGRR